jgi:choline dehydrogenase-like flavoprotein
MDVAVVGSGLIGLAVAQGLVGRGVRVTLLDVGETLDARRRAIVEKLKYLPPVDWPEKDLAVLAENATIGPGKLPKKVFFGSDQIYADKRAFARTVPLQKGRVPLPTFMKGGFSNIWGRRCLRPMLATWPTGRSRAPRWTPISPERRD